MAWRLVALVVFTEAQQVPATCAHVKRDKWTKKVCKSSRDLRLSLSACFQRDGIGMIVSNVDMLVPWCWILEFVYSFKFQVHQG